MNDQLLLQFDSGIKVRRTGRERSRRIEVPTETDTPWVDLGGGRRVRVYFSRNPRASRYILRVDREGDVRVTIPRRGSLQDARSFLSSRRSWIEKQRLKVRGRDSERRRALALGLVWFRGREVKIELVASRRMLRLGEELIPVTAQKLEAFACDNRDLRRLAEDALRHAAVVELPAVTWRLAREHGLDRLREVTVRNQRSRWGSCSSQGTISLNWRLLQTPRFVRDYVILHELVHLRHLNHSDRFWKQVASVCRRWEEAESWLKAHGDLLLD
jgi:hypothetical protein